MLIKQYIPCFSREMKTDLPALPTILFQKFLPFLPKDQNNINISGDML